MANTSTHEPIDIPTNAKLLRNCYGASNKTWNKWLRPLNLPPFMKEYTHEVALKIVLHLGPSLYCNFKMPNVAQ
jgi:hypothetical protein